MVQLTHYVALLRDLVLIGLGIYAAVIVKRQLELKQAEIETRKATEEHLRALQAPALAKDLKEISQLADKLSEDKRELEKRLQKEGGRAKEEAEKAEVAGIAVGCMEGLGAVFEIYRTLNVTLNAHKSGEISSLLAPFLQLQEMAAEKRTQLQRAFAQAVQGTRPELLNAKALMERFGIERVPRAGSTPEKT